MTLLKVVDNEKGGGLGGCLLFEDGFGPWQSMSVRFLILLSCSSTSRGSEWQLITPFEWLFA